MLIKYFSFNNEKILFVNTKACDTLHISDCGRVLSFIDTQQIVNMQILENEFDNYFSNGGYITRYLNQAPRKKINPCPKLNQKISKAKGAVIVRGDSREILSKISDNFFTVAVTSPPYYNAREYSQWSNLYLYLSDMYDIIKEAYRTIKPGGIFLYNVGDICGNENTVVSSVKNELY